MEALPSPPNGLQFFQCLLFHGKIGVQGHVGRFDTSMAEPQRNGSDIHASLEQMHGGRVSYDIRRNFLVARLGHVVPARWMACFKR